MVLGSWEGCAIVAHPRRCGRRPFYTPGLVTAGKSVMVNRRELIAAAGIAAAAAGAASGADRPAPRRGQSRVWRIGSPPSIANLTLATRDTPEPGPGEALVRVVASSINARDRGIVAGIFFIGDRKASIPLSEGAGEVVALGAGVANVKVGDRVACCHFPDWVDGRWNPAVYERDIGNTLDGWLAEYALLPAQGLVVLPAAVSYESAATLASSGVTAWHALYEVARLRPGQTVLTLGTGGVSTIGLQLAKATGARVVVTSSRDDKLARLRELGADVTVNYRTEPEWGKTVAAQTGGVDVVLENVGRPTLDQSMEACAPGATIVMIGTGPLPQQLPKMPGFYTKNLTMKAISNGSVRMFADLLNAMAAADIQPVIEKTFAFEDAIAAFREMEASDHVGKVLIRHT
jgi:NADPH:quinone reductase-like Zn-dependent oxidoreductase